MNKIKGSIIGLGKMGLSHASIVGAHPSVEFVAVCDTSSMILDAFKKRKGDWNVYEVTYLKLISGRKVESKLSQAAFEKRTVLLCSEPTAEKCHRRLAAEYLAEAWGGIGIVHL